MSNFEGTIDELLTNIGFKLVPTEDESVKCYTKGNSTLLVQQDTSGRIELNNGSNKTYRGSHFSFTLKGKVKPDVSEQMYLKDLLVFTKETNGRYGKEGITISSFSFFPPKDQQVKVSNLLLEYIESTSPGKIGTAIADIQDGLFKLMSKYVAK